MYYRLPAWYVFSAPIVLVLVLVLVVVVVVLVLGRDRGGFAQDGIGVNGESKRRGFAGSRKNGRRRRGRLGNDAKQIPGTGPPCMSTQAFVPGYDRAVPPGQKPFTHRSASH